MYGNPYYDPYWLSEDETLEHFGIKGMKWGVRRYQNADGTLTEAGKKRLEKYRVNEQVKVIKRYEKEKKRDVKLGALQRDKELTEKQRRHAAQVHKRNFDAEMKALEKMTFKDMQNEKSEIGKQWLKSSATTFGTLAVSLVTPMPFYVISWPNYKTIKANYRAPGEIRSERQLNYDYAQIAKMHKNEKRNQQIAKYLS